MCGIGWQTKIYFDCGRRWWSTRRTPCNKNERKSPPTETIIPIRFMTIFYVWCRANHKYMNEKIHTQYKTRALCVNSSGYRNVKCSNVLFLWRNKRPELKQKYYRENLLHRIHISINCVTKGTPSTGEQQQKNPMVCIRAFEMHRLMLEVSGYFTGFELFKANKHIVRTYTCFNRPLSTIRLPSFSLSEKSSRTIPRPPRTTAKLLDAATLHNHCI